MKRPCIKCNLNEVLYLSQRAVFQLTLHTHVFVNRSIKVFGMRVPNKYCMGWNTFISF